MDNKPKQAIIPKAEYPKVVVAYTSQDFPYKPESSTLQTYKIPILRPVLLSKL